MCVPDFLPTFTKKLKRLKRCVKARYCTTKCITVRVEYRKLDLSRSCVSHSRVPAFDFAWLRTQLADVWNLRSSELSPSVIDMMRRSMEKPSLPSNNPSKLIMLKIAWGYWLHVLAQKHYAIAIKLAKEVDSFLFFFHLFFIGLISYESLTKTGFLSWLSDIKTQLLSINKSFARDPKMLIFASYISHQVSSERTSDIWRTIAFWCGIKLWTCTNRSPDQHGQCGLVVLYICCAKVSIVPVLN